MKSSQTIQSIFRRSLVNMESSSYVTIGPIKVHKTLHSTIEKEILPGTQIAPKAFWNSLGSVLVDFRNTNEALLRKRDSIQAQIDAYLLENKGQQWDAGRYTAFLSDIGYLAPSQGADFTVETENVDAEVSSTPGPQLVVPVDKARFALNAANARWGSLLDAYYGTDAGHIPDEGELKKGKEYNPKRGEKVYELVHQFIDEYFPLTAGKKFKDVTAIKVNEKPHRLSFKMADGSTAYLDRDSQFVGHVPGNGDEPKYVYLIHNALHVELGIDKNSSMGKTHKCGLSEVNLESAITAICDCEDSVAAVDAEDKSLVYSNWSGLMKATLTEQLTKTKTRKLNKDKPYVARDGSEKTLKGRALLFVRNVGIHMYTDAVKYVDNDTPVPEGLLDAMVTTVAARHDIVSKEKSRDLMNSVKGSMYIVKPKMHGPEEVAYTVRVMERVEKELGLPKETIKIGIMDEERRTTVNLKECIRAARRRCVFINTGFLDRTGDEIHTSFAYGPVLPKKEIEAASWKTAYEDWNVDVGLEVGLPRCGQIGKGMWAAPNAMADMMKKKLGHPKSGATTAWVPSPTAATLHAIHYHMQSVPEAQARILQTGRRGKLSDILTPPFLNRKLTSQEIIAELENNAQGILGYVSRWILMGIGCSTVPDLHDVGLMEDRATLRISSQHIANWLEHGVVTHDDVMKTFEKMAKVVDRQNHGVQGYRNMGDDPSNLGFQCALELVFRGREEPNGLTERTLSEFRRKAKESPLSKL